VQTITLSTASCRCRCSMQVNSTEYKYLSIQVWIFSLFAIIVITYLTHDLLKINFADYINLISKALVALLLSIAISYTAKSLNKHISYLLFFLITITSFLGLSKTLTGSYSESPYVALYGLSFYSASLAYAIKKGLLTESSPFIASNPLLLITGPIATMFQSTKHRALSRRIAYYFPFILIGVFLHQIIATPLTETFTLIERTDVSSSIVFAIIFEVFVYTNFAGLSLMVYGIMGIIGIRIPLNFRQPFSSNNVIEFWRGWHTSISTVLKELFFNPIKKLTGTSVAIFAVFISSALWHGVSLNFLLWGILHASCFVITLFLLRRKVPIIPTIVQMSSLVVARMMSADADTARLFTKLRFDFNGFNILEDLNARGTTVKAALVLGLSFILIEMVFKGDRHFRKRNYKFYRLPYTQFTMLFILLMAVAANSGISYAVYGQR
jgi:alginate O-acetyltransferase complex protein AlgI